MTASERRYQAFLGARAREGLRRSLLAVAARDARIIGAEGRSYVNFSSNDYLGLRFNKALVDRVMAWAEIYGVGSGASRLVTGNLELFAPIEAKVAHLKGKPAALVMASGFQTNAAVLQALLDRSVLGAEHASVEKRLEHGSVGLETARHDEGRGLALEMRDLGFDRREQFEIAGDEARGARAHAVNLRPRPDPVDQ